MSNKNPFDSDAPNQISLICNAVGHRPRIMQCIQAVNESRLIEACMLQVYDKVDRIIVIEGATKAKVDAGQATHDGYSTDDTADIISRVITEKDPDKKIIFVQINRPWNDLEEIKNTFFSYMSDGDWMLITDADEFIHPEVVDDLRHAISVEPFATEFVPSFYHFWKDTKHIRNPSKLGFGTQHQRFIKFQQGLRYVTHPVATDSFGQCTYFSNQYLPRRFVLPSFEIFHYSYMSFKRHDIEQKKVFYERELKEKAAHTERAQIDDQFFNNTEGVDDLLVFDGDHPKIIQRMPWYSDINVGLLNSEDNETYWPRYNDREPYSLNPVPLIWAFYKDGREPFTRLFNTVELYDEPAS